MNRRQFITAVASGLVTASVLGASKTAGLPKRKLGRTGIEVPILGFGGGSRFRPGRQAALHHFLQHHADV